MKGTAEVKVSTDDGCDMKWVANLKSPDYFGEGGLMTDEPRKATIVAQDALTTLSITREKFQALGLNDKLHFAKRRAVAALDLEEEKERGSTDKDAETEKLIANALRSNRNLNALVKLTEDRIKQMVESA